MKKWIIALFSILSVAILGFFVWMDVTQETGLFSSSWWWIGELILFLLCGIIWFVVWRIKISREKIEFGKSKDEDKKGDVFDYQKILDSYWKHKENKDPDMYRISKIISFPSEDHPQIKIIETKKGYNLGKTLFLAVDQKQMKVIAKSEDGNLDKFKELLKPKLTETIERYERDEITGKTQGLRTTKPLEEALKEQKEKEDEEERQAKMETAKKEEK